MNREDEYQSWLNAKRAESPPADLTDRIMAAVRESTSPPTASARPEAVPSAILQRAIPYLICSAAAMVLAMRLYSFVSVFVVASSEIVMTESVEEFSNVSKP